MITFKSNGYNTKELIQLQKILTKGYQDLDCYYGCPKCPNRVLCTDLSNTLEHLERLIAERQKANDNG